MNTLTCSPEKRTTNLEKIRQFLEECESWKRFLDFISGENNHFKIRLRHIQNLDIGEKVPGKKKETLQLDIQKTDQLISLNKSAIINYEKWLIRQPSFAQEEIETIFERHLEVCKQIERVEINFSLQKVTFNDQLTRNL